MKKKYKKLIAIALMLFQEIEDMRASIIDKVYFSEVMFQILKLESNTENSRDSLINQLSEQQKPQVKNMKEYYSYMPKVTVSKKTIKYYLEGLLMGLAFVQKSNNSIGLRTNEHERITLILSTGHSLHFILNRGICPEEGRYLITASNQKGSRDFNVPMSWQNDYICSQIRKYRVSDDEDLPFTFDQMVDLVHLLGGINQHMTSLLLYKQ